MSNDNLKEEIRGLISEISEVDTVPDDTSTTAVNNSITLSSASNLESSGRTSCRLFPSVFTA